MSDKNLATLDLGGALARVAVPAVDIPEIRRCMAARSAPRAFAWPMRTAASLAVVLLLAIFLTTKAPALVMSLRERSLAALHAVGIGAGLPNAEPASIATHVVTTKIALAQARRNAGFSIVEPSGLPSDVTGRELFSAPLAVWSRSSKTWVIDGTQLTFHYARRDGRSFDIIADRYVARDYPAPKYIYDADAASVRQAMQNRREHFVWRVGDEALAAIASPNILATEIERVRLAMRGVALPRIDRRGRHNGAQRNPRFTIAHPVTSN